jgi:hypothetical protein
MFGQRRQQGQHWWWRQTYNEGPAPFVIEENESTDG